ISLFWIYVCYSGWNAATYVAEELKLPERTLPMALTFGTLLVASIYIALNAEVTVGPRVYYAMAQNRAFFKMAAHVHPRWRTPVIAILCQGLCAVLMTLTPFPD